MKFNEYQFDEEKILGKVLYRDFNKTLSKYEFDVEYMLDDLGPDKTIEYFFNLIEKCPSFITAYDYLLETCFSLENAEELIDQVSFSAYNETKKLLDAEKSKLPLSVDWAFLENRPLLRSLLNYALFLYENKEDLQAKALFEYILTISINDSMGARYHYLAIDQGITFKRFQSRFTDSEGISKPNLFTWFEKNFERSLTLIGWTVKCSMYNDFLEDSYS